MWKWKGLDLANFRRNLKGLMCKLLNLSNVRCHLLGLQSQTMWRLHWKQQGLVVVKCLLFLFLLLVFVVDVFFWCFCCCPCCCCWCGCWPCWCCGKNFGGCSRSCFSTSSCFCSCSSNCCCSYTYLRLSIHATVYLKHPTDMWSKMIVAYKLCILICPTC